MFGLNPKRKILEKKQKLLSEKMTHKVITCFFCFEQFEVSLEIGTSFTGNITEIYDCEICCNPNKLDYEVYDGEININNVGDGNE